MESPNILIDECKKEWCKKNEKKFNLAHFSEDSGVKLTSTWFYFRGERRWPAESWVRALVYFGIAKVDPDKCSIQINFVKNADTRKALKRMIGPKEW
jgi:hypothetical protein